jgi:hypothetical protein
MPRARDKNKFRRGREQQYKRYHIAQPSTARHVHLPVFPLVTITGIVAISITTFWFREVLLGVVFQLIHIIHLPTLPAFSLKVPVISLPEFTLPAIRLPEIHVHLSVQPLLQLLSMLWRTIIQQSIAFGNEVFQIFQYIGRFIFASVVFGMHGIGTFFESLWAVSVVVFQTVLSISSSTGRVLGTLLISAVHLISVMFIRITLFVDPVPAQVTLLQGEVSIVTGVIALIVAVVMATYHVGVVIGQLVWGIYTSIGNAIGSLFHAVGTSASNTKHASDRQLQTVGKFIQPIFSFIFKTIGDSMGYLGSGLSDMGKIVMK